MRIFTTLAVTVALLAAAAAGVRAQELEHPLQVLHVNVEHDGGTLGVTTGKGTIWIKNLADVAVDGVKVELKMKTPSGRVSQTIIREVGKIDAGRKSYVDFKWEDYKGQTLKPEIWLIYNGGGTEPVRFHAEPPVW